MSTGLFHAALTTVVFWTCLSFSVGSERPVSETATTVLLPMKYTKSRATTYQEISGIREPEGARNEAVRATQANNRSPSPAGVNFYRLPPSPANLLKPDGFQFYTYNERGDMITKQMTMQEIQALIASGGPDHSNVEVQEPQKAEDILTGGKKVMDVVEKVQNVLKSAMDKPLSALSGSHPMIPEKVNVEWSNILPAILAGDKYGNKVEESHHVERPTSKPMSKPASTYYVAHNQNDSTLDSLESNASETVPSEGLENVKVEKNGTQPTIATKPTTVSYTEKLMIPVPVITTERNAESIGNSQFTTQSPTFHKLTEATPLLENTTYGSYDRDDENLTSVNPVTKSTTTGVSLLASTLQLDESTKSSYDNADLVSEILHPEKNNSHVDETVTDSLVTQTKIKPVIIGTSSTEDDEVLMKTQTPPVVEANQVQTVITNEPFSKLPLQYSVSVPATTNKHKITSVTEQLTTTQQDTVTKPSDRLSGSVEPSISSPSMELVSSLSNVISQISDDTVSPVLSSSFGFQSTFSGNENKRNNGSEIIATYSSTINGDRPENVNATSDEERIQESFTDTTVKFKTDRERISLTAATTPIISTNVTELDKTTNHNVSTVSTKFDGITSVHPVSNVTEAPMSINETSATTFNSFQPIALIDSILYTASPETNTPVTESITLPSDLSENLLANTLASSLIANPSNLKINKTQTVLDETTTSYSEKLNSTDTVALNSKLPISINKDIMNDTMKKDPTNENEVSRTSTTKEHLFTEQQKIESSQLQNELSVTSESTTTSSFITADSVLKNAVETDGISGTLFANNTLNEQTSNPIYETTISSNEASTTSTNTRVIVPNVENVTEEASQNSDMISTISLDETTEISSSERDKPPAHHTVDKLTTNWTAVANLSNAEEHPAQNVTDKIALQRPLKKTEEQSRNDTVHTTATQHEINAVSSTTATSFNDTKSFVASTTPESITAALNSSTKESNEIKGTTSATNSDEMNSTDYKTKKPAEPYLHASNSTGMELLEIVDKSSHSNESKLNDSASSTLQSKTNDTHANSEHTWQRISLHQATPSLSMELTTTPTMYSNEISTSTSASTLANTSSTKLPSNSQPIPANGTESTVSLDASKSVGGLDTSTRNASVDIVNFSRLCNELAIKFWIAANNGLSIGRSFALSPFGMTSLLAMIFLGARGSTSDQMNEILGLDNVATFNPHLIFQNVTDTVSLARHQGIANAAFVRELFADKAKVRKLLPFYKEQAQQFYEGLVAEVNFATISDLARRRTNLLIRKQTGGRIKDFVKSNTVPLRSPLAAISANVFQTDCNTSYASATGRDGELYFAVSAAHRLRKLIPVPATVWRSNVLAGYEPSLDATASAIGSADKLVSTIFLVPGQQGHAAPGDTLDRLEQRLVKGAFQDGTWNKLLKVLIPRPGLELQIPKFSHRSVVNATAALKRMGLDQLFSTQADFKGINGIGNRLFLSDVLQMNLFSTCGDENIASGRHHVEIYPASASLRNSRRVEEQTFRRIRRTVDTKSENYRTVSLKERIRNVERSEEKPRLRLDQPFLYFVRHNPTGLILHIGRFNPRLI
ncbi:Ovalbumin-related protein Y [Melipona quadrifasciata]|uniref:Ovalbumin-related protein Y n=1 Tax=Melipona quadrifasciata TaxID=166423 RepID=A0A0M9A942_9HYME|nr:Ovalbumin-related protein Y [Melipona quadrifasciata]